MKTKVSLIALAVSSFAVLGASAQAATPPGHDWIPAGEAADEVMAPPTTSTTTREAVKEQTLEARNRGGLQSAGDIGGDRKARVCVDGTIAPFGETAGAE